MKFLLCAMTKLGPFVHQTILSITEAINFRRFILKTVSVRGVLRLNSLLTMCAIVIGAQWVYVLVCGMPISTTDTGKIIIIEKKFPPSSESIFPSANRILQKET